MTSGSPRSLPRFRRWAIAAFPSVSGVLFLVVLSSIPAQGLPGPSMASPPQVWVESGHHWYNNTTSHSAGHFNITYNVSAFLGFSERITATNTSNTTTQMSGVRSVNESVVASWCVPNCTLAMYRETVHLRGSDVQTQFLNLTTRSQVYENGTAAAALGVTYESGRRVQNLSENTNTTYGNHSFLSSFQESELAHFAVQFHPSLGLIPWNLSTHLRWNSTSRFTASGGWNDSFAFSVTHNGTPYSRSWNDSGTLNRTGNESVYGADLGNQTVHNHTSQRIGLHFWGPFGFDDELFLTAIGSDLFQNATANWSVRSPWSEGEAGTALVNVYAQHAAIASPPVPTSGGGSSSTSSSTGSSGSTNPAPTSGSPTSTSSPGATTPNTPTPRSVSPSPPVSNAGGKTAPHLGASALPWAIFGILGALVAIGAAGSVWHRRRRAP